MGHFTRHPQLTRVVVLEGIVPPEGGEARIATHGLPHRSEHVDTAAREVVALAAAARCLLLRALVARQAARTRSLRVEAGQAAAARLTPLRVRARVDAGAFRRQVVQLEA